MANGFDFSQYVPARPRRDPALDQWAAQGMIGPRPAPRPSPAQMAVPQGMNPYDLGQPPVMSAAPAPSQGGYIGETYIPGYDGTAPPPAASVPPMQPQAPAPSGGGNIGETYIPDFDTVRSEGVANAPLAGGIGAILGALRGRGSGGGVSGMAPPPSRRYAMGIPKTDFIYTNPASAQQAAASLQARLGYEQGQDQGYRQYQIARDAAQQQAMQQQNFQAQRAAEAEKDRALQREGFASSERSAQARGGYGQSEFDLRQRARNQEIADERRALDVERFRQASSLAAYLNNPNISPLEKSKRIDPQAVHQGPDGQWIPSVPNPAAVQAQPQSNVPTIGQIQSGVAGGAPISGTPPMFAGPPAPPPPPPPPAPWYKRFGVDGSGPYFQLSGTSE